MNFKIAPEGARTVNYSVLFFVVSLPIAFYAGYPFVWGLPVLTGLYAVSMIQFFRDPDRKTPPIEGSVFSPADGRIIFAGAGSERSPLQPFGQQVSIFMSPINVHVNRAPFAGTIVDAVHTPGKFLSAFKPMSSLENENNLVTMQTSAGAMAFRQISGFLARRIVFHAKPGDTVQPGERVGMIRFGSRVDLYLPDNIKITVNVGDKVSAGISVLGELIDR